MPTCPEGSSSLVIMGTTSLVEIANFVIPGAMEFTDNGRGATAFLTVIEVLNATYHLLWWMQ